MDNLTHSLCGWNLARAGLNRDSKWATPFLIVLANLPDLEPVLLPGRAPGAYLLYHRGFTHSVPMLIAYAVVFGALLWWLERPRSLSYWKATGICAAGLYSHLLLDGLNNYGVRPGIPVDSNWYYGDMIFIVDPWVWLMFGVPLFLGSTLTARGAAGWVVLGILTSTLIFYGMYGNFLPLFVVVLWFVAIVATVFIRWRRHLDAERCARIGLVVLSMYLVMVLAASRVSLERAKAQLEAVLPGSNAELVRASVSPYPAQPWRFDVLLQTNQALSQVKIDFFGTHDVRPGSVKLNLDDPALNKIRGTFEYRAWRSFARHPYAIRNGNVMILGDMRFKSRGSDWSALSVEIPAD